MSWRDVEERLMRRIFATETPGLTDLTLSNIAEARESSSEDDGFWLYVFDDTLAEVMRQENEIVGLRAELAAVRAAQPPVSGTFPGIADANTRAAFQQQEDRIRRLELDIELLRGTLLLYSSSRAASRRAFRTGSALSKAVAGSRHRGKARRDDHDCSSSSPEMGDSVVTPERIAELRKRPDLIDSDEGEVDYLLDALAEARMEAAKEIADVVVYLRAQAARPSRSRREAAVLLYCVEGIELMRKAHPRTDSSAAPFLPPYERCVRCGVPPDGQDPCEPPRRAVYFVDPRRDPRPGPDPLACPRCGDPPAHAGAVYCGAACAALDGAAFI